MTVPLKSLLPLIPAGLFVDRVAATPDRVSIFARATAAGGICPTCGRASQRLHSRYLRRLGDLPWQGRVVDLHLQARRFRCPAPECPCRIFGERLPSVMAPRVRRTVRLAEIQRHIGFGMGGEPEARLAKRLSMPVSGDALLWLVRAAYRPAPPPARIIGIDDWAWRRGRRYGTIVVDLERNRPIDLLPDHRAETVATWLAGHPEVEVVARDRAGAYAEGVRLEAPQAIQAADRWHLLRNLGDAVRHVFDRHHADLRAAARGAVVEPVTEKASGPEPLRLPRPTRRQQCGAAKQAARHARYAEVAALQGQGWSQSRIAGTLGLDRKTVRVWLRAGQPPNWSQPAKGSLLDAHVNYLRRRWNEGCWNATQLWREIQQRGFSGQSRIVRDWVHGLRVNEPTARSAAKSTWRVPSGRRAAWLVAARPEEIDRTEQAFVAALITGSPSLERVIHLARTFRDIVSGQKADQLDGWLAAARETPLAGFAHGLQRDLPAVRAALSLRWSTSPVEGQINRLKSVKRQMYGRAGFDLLQQRVLGTA